MKRLFCFIFLFLYFLTISAQQRILDSLQAIVNDKSIQDRDKIMPMSKIAGLAMGDTIRSMKLGKKSVALARLQQDPSYAVYAYSNLGLFYVLRGDVKRTYEIIDSCLWYINKSKDVYANATAYNRIGVMKLQMDDKEGIADIFTSINIFKNAPNKGQGISANNNKWEALTSGYYLLCSHYAQDIENVDKYSKLTLEAAFKSENLNLISSGYSIRGIRFLTEYQSAKRNNLLDSAQYYLEKALLVSEKRPGYIRDISYLNILSNLVGVYEGKYEAEKNNDYLKKMAKCVEKAKIIAKRNHDVEFRINYYKLLISVKMSKEDYRSAIQLTEEIIDEVSKQDKLNRYKYELYYLLSSLYQKTGNQNIAIENLKKAFTYYQKYFDEKYVKVGQQQQVKYKLAEKEREIEIRKKQNVWYIAFACILFILLILVFFVFRFRVKYLKNKKEEANLLAKLKEEEAKFLEVEKENAELQIRIKEEEAHRLQKEVLSRTNQIVYKNEMLKNLTDTIKNDPNFNTFLLERMIKEEERLDKNFDDFVNVLNEIHPEFYNRLQEKTKQKLTSLDLKYCVYIFMKMPTKEMADLLHVELKTVRMNKYRLKQKLGLKKEDSLEEFIQNII